MRKFALLLVCLVSICQFTIAEEPESSKNKGSVYMYFSPFNMTVMQLQMGLEYLFPKEKQSLLLLGGFQYGNTMLSVDEIRVGADAELQYRRNLVHSTWVKKNRTRRSSFFVYTGPYAKYQYLDVRDSRNVWDPWTGSNMGSSTLFALYNSIGAGFIVGTKFVLAEKFVIDTWVGPGMKYTLNDHQQPNFKTVYFIGHRGMVPRANVQVGFCF